MLHIGTAVRASHFGVVSIKPSIQTLVTKCMAALSGVGFVHGSDADSTCYDGPQLIQAPLQDSCEVSVT